MRVVPVVTTLVPGGWDQSDLAVDPSVVEPVDVLRDQPDSTVSEVLIVLTSPLLPTGALLTVRRVGTPRRRATWGRTPTSGHRRLQDDSVRAGVWPRSVRVLGGKVTSTNAVARQNLWGSNPYTRAGRIRATNRCRPAGC